MLTRRKLAPLHDHRLEEIRLARPGERREQPPGWLGEEGVVTGRWPRRLGLAWILVCAAAIAVEPAPADPADPVPVWATALFFSLVGALGVMAGGLARRQRLGLVASVVAAGVALLGAVLCPVSDHHGTVGAWWYLQMVGFTGLMGAGLVGLRRARPPLASPTG